MMGDLVLVTGGTGYIANYIIAELLRNGFSVRTTVRDRTSAKVDILKAGCNVEGHAGAVELVETDLSSAEGWREACEGCKYVIHTASPVGDFEMNNSGFYPGMKLRNDEETNRLVQSAVDGTRFVMEAAADCGTCERVVVTSSTITISPLSKDMIFAEYPRRVDQWTEVEGTEGYQRAKILAERAAWEIAESRGLDLVTILPARTIGPSMTKINRSSVLYILDDILFQANPGLWRRLPIAENPSVDVRDVAKMHVASMLKPEAVGRRFIAYSSSPLPKDIIDPLKSAGYNHVTTPLNPSFVSPLLSLLGNCSPTLEAYKSLWGRSFDVFDSADAEAVLGFEYIPLEQTILDYAENAEELGLIPEKYSLRR